MPFSSGIAFQAFWPHLRDLFTFMETEPRIRVWGLKPAKLFI